MLQTFDRTKWVENSFDEKARELFNATTPVAVLREHYPYCGIVQRTIPTYGIKAGTVLQYVRTLYEPNMYPIEAIIGVQGEPSEKPRRLRLQSAELLICEV